MGKVYDFSTGEVTDRGSPPPRDGLGFASCGEYMIVDPKTGDVRFFDEVPKHQPPQLKLVSPGFGGDGG